MGVPPTSPRGDSASDSVIQFFNREIAEEIRVQLAYWSTIADSQAAIDDLHGKFAVRGRAPVGNAPGIFEILNQLLGPQDVASHAVAEKHEVIATRLRAKVSVKSKQPIDSAGRGSEMLGHHLGCLERHPAEMFVDFLERGEDQFLSFLEIAVGEVGEDPSYFIQVN